MKITGSTCNLRLKLFPLRVGEVNGIPGVAVKCVDIRRNTGGEGGYLAMLLTLRHESMGIKQD